MKTNLGNFFEDFRVGQEIVHATPRTVTAGDVALYTALFGSRFALHSSDQFASLLGYRQAPIDDLLVFHIVFGKTVADISLNAIANLGYAEVKFGAVVYPGDSLRTITKVIGLKENSSHQSGVVYVHSTGFNQKDEKVVEFIRWVMVKKRHFDSPEPEAVLPHKADQVQVDHLTIPPFLTMKNYPLEWAGSPYFWDDYERGESLDHHDGITVEEAEHMMATRLYQNNAKIHFNQHSESTSRFGRRLIYGGHVISLARSLSFNGLANGFRIVAINGGRHIAPLFAGNTVYAWSFVKEKITIPNRDDIGALRIVTRATKDFPCDSFPILEDHQKGDHPSLILELDYTVLFPRKGS
jgi:2-methylfumaryl-CoA hydratase